MYVQHRWQGLDVQPHQARGAARGHHVVGHHQRHHLPPVLHRVAGQHRFVVGKRGEHRIAWDIAVGDDRPHTRLDQGGAGVDAAQPAVRHGRAHRRSAQAALQQRQVVDIGHRTRHLCVGAFVVIGLAHHPLGVVLEQSVQPVHAMFSRSLRLKVSMRGGGCSPHSAAARCIRLRSSARR